MFLMKPRFRAGHEGLALRLFIGQIPLILEVKKLYGKVDRLSTRFLLRRACDSNCDSGRLIILFVLFYPSSHSL